MAKVLVSLDDRLLAGLEPDLILTQELCSVCAVSYPTVLQAARSAGGEDGNQPDRTKGAVTSGCPAAQEAATAS